jgi:hypothetical protein
MPLAFTFSVGFATLTSPKMAADAVAGAQSAIAHATAVRLLFKLSSPRSTNRAAQL